MENLIKEKLPENLIEKIIKQYGEELSDKIFSGFLTKRNVSLRINTLKCNKEEFVKFLDEKNIKYSFVNWYENAIVLYDISEKEIESTSFYSEGKIYLQNLSSMLPPVLLEPKEKTDILDMTAAPGGKTTEIAALTNNKSYITACELNKIRAERLKYNINLQSANAYVVQKDARDLDDFLKFDQILLDAPCSGSGTILLDENSEEVRFTIGFEEKLEKVQTKLLDKAVKLLKKGETMVYSTCSILERENENIVNKFIKTGKMEIVTFDENMYKDIEKLPCNLKGAICVMPNENYEGFFAVKLRKK